MATLVAGVTAKTIVAGPCTLDRINVSNSNAATQTLLIEDGTVSLGTYNIAPGTTVPLDFSSPVDRPLGGASKGLPIVTSLGLTPSHANISAAVFFH